MARLLLVCLSLLLFVSTSPASCDYIKARPQFGKTFPAECSFSVDDSTVSQCETSLRQVFRLLFINETVGLGSTECLYSFDLDLDLQRSQRIVLPQTGDKFSICAFANARNVDFYCRNYISYGHVETSNPLEYRVCGTFNSASPECYNCSDDETNITCNNGTETAFMPRNPVNNVTVSWDSEENVYFIGGLESHSRDNHILAKVDISSPGEGDSIVTDDGNTRVMNVPQDFVGEPLEYGPHVYFFFREKALEYENIGQIIYSRVARVCKNDTGGTQSPLTREFLTYLKTRLTCSVGNEFPFFFNEIQDVTQSPSDSNFIYGLFTTLNAGTSSSAICRYDMRELAALFDNDLRRGQPMTNEIWQEISRHPEDTAAKRQCTEVYTDAIYDHLEDYPLLNTNALNCGLGKNCSDYARQSDDALAVFEEIRGQQLAVSFDSRDNVRVYIGTNNRIIYEANIMASAAYITGKIEVNTPDFTESQIADKWPYGISSLTVNNGNLYGTMDNCLFMIEPLPPPEVEIKDRSENVDYNHTHKIDNAVTNVFKLFEAPQGTDMQASFSEDLKKHNCSQELFTCASSCKEFLHIHIGVSGIDSSLDGSINIISQSGVAQTVEVPVHIDIDVTGWADVDVNEVSTYDKKMAKYHHDFESWLRQNVTCENASMSTCPAATSCGYC